MVGMERVGLLSPVGGALGNFIHEHLDHLHSDFVGSGVVVAELGIVAGDLIIHHQPAFVTYRPCTFAYLMADRLSPPPTGRRSPGTGSDARRREEGHLNFFIAVFIVHMDDVQGVV